MYRFKSLFSSTHLKRFGYQRRRDGTGKKVLPPNVVRLTCESATKRGVCDVYVIGTVHDHPKCARDVRAVVKFLKPQVVFLEKCSDRVSPALEKFSSEFKVSTVLKANSKLEFEDEFQAAFEEAYKCGADIILGDRHQEISSRRFKDKFARTPFWQIMKISLSRFINGLPMNFSHDDFYKMPATFVTESVRKLEGPIFNEIWVDERDQYMSAMLLKVARKHNLVVAVVGKGHLLGIQKYWKQPIEVEQLLSIPLETKNFSYRMKSAAGCFFFHSPICLELCPDRVCPSELNKVSSKYKIKVKVEQLLSTPLETKNFSSRVKLAFYNYLDRFL